VGDEAVEISHGLDGSPDRHSLLKQKAGQTLNLIAIIGYPARTPITAANSSPFKPVIRGMATNWPFLICLRKGLK